MPSARILTVDDDEELLQLLGDTLTRDGFRVSSAGSAAAALEFGGSAFDLVVSDIDLPGKSGLDLRDEWHRQAGNENTPFLFVSALDPVIEAQVARRLGKDKLLAKPFTRAALRRAVYGALRLARVTVGPIATTLDRIFLECAEQRGTGVLTAVSGPVTKRVVVEEGEAIFAFSNDPRDLIGQAFLRAGLITEADLLEAFALWNEHPAARGTPGLAAALAALKKVTPEQSRAVFEKKIREAILDLYLWSDGMVEFVEGAVAADEHPFPFTLDLATLRRDGAKRRAHWTKANAIVPDRSMRYQRAAAPWPEGFPATNGDLALARHLEHGRSLAEILVEFRGQDYGIVMRVADLVRRGCVALAPERTFEAPPAGDAAPQALNVSAEFDAMFGELGDELAQPPATVAPEDVAEADSALDRRLIGITAGALVKMRTGDLQGARAGFLDVLTSDPFNTLARDRLEETEAAITAAARGGGLRNDDRLRLAIPVQELTGKTIPPHDAFVISRLAAGSRTVGELVHLCPFPEHEVLEILVRNLGSAVLARS